MNTVKEEPLYRLDVEVQGKAIGLFAVSPNAALLRGIAARISSGLESIGGNDALVKGVVSLAGVFIDGKTCRIDTYPFPGPNTLVLGGRIDDTMSERIV
jgi:hypothetical protein